MLEIWIDGAITKNPGGVATYGFLAKRDGVTIYEESGMVGEGSQMSNNVAEFAALCAALEYLSGEPAIIYTDAEIILRKMKRLHSPPNGLYAAQCVKARVLFRDNPEITFRWIPREQNEEADALSRAALDALNAEEESELHEAIRRD
ncbi:MAG: reverse transcriptase-like protein [Patescibacteria group bacterium]|nr:reverse transcriptase-like protein [Patescibacteria group bacterium]